MRREKLMALGLAVATTLCLGEVAAARGLCGAGWHRGPHGRCVRNVVAPARPVTVVVQPTQSNTTIIYAPIGKPCPVGYHLGPAGRRCWPN